MWIFHILHLKYFPSVTKRYIKSELNDNDLERSEFCMQTLLLIVNVTVKNIF